MRKFSVWERAQMSLARPWIWGQERFTHAGHPEMTNGS